MKRFTREEIVESTGNTELLFLEEIYFDKAILGVVYDDQGVMRVVYDCETIIEALISFVGFNVEDAVEYFEFNILNSRGAGLPYYLMADFY